MRNPRCPVMDHGFSQFSFVTVRYYMHHKTLSSNMAHFLNQFNKYRYAAPLECQFLAAMNSLTPEQACMQGKYDVQNIPQKQTCHQDISKSVGGKQGAVICLYNCNPYKVGVKGCGFQLYNQSGDETFYLEPGSYHRTMIVMRGDTTHAGVNKGDVNTWKMFSVFSTEQSGFFFKDYDVVDTQICGVDNIRRV